MKISSKLKNLIQKERKKDLTIKQMIDKFNEKDYLFLIILFALPPATPLAFIPGFSFLFGLSIALISIHLLLGRKKPWLPKKLFKKKIASQKINQAIDRASPYIEKLENFVQLRFVFLSSKRIKYFFIALILALSFFLMTPIPYVDFISSVLIILISIGLIERDGLLLLVVSCIASLFLFAIFFFLKTITLFFYNFI